MFGFRYPAVILLVCAVIGTVLGRSVTFGIEIIVIIVISATAFLPYSMYRLPAGYFVIPLAVLSIAAAVLKANGIYRRFPPHDVGYWAGEREPVRFFGEIEKWPLIKRNRTLIVCRIDSLCKIDSISAASGSVLLDVERETTHFSLGDKISFSGILRMPYSARYPGQFDYSRYLRSRGIRGAVSIRDPAHIMVLKQQGNVLSRSVSEIRQWILECIQTHMTDVPAALASGFLIGETRDIPEDIYQAFRRTGTMHLLAVSGSNVALVLVAIASLFRVFRLRRYMRLGLLLAVIVIFSHLSYNQPSVVRASIMAALVLVARAFSRRADLHNIIAAAAAALIFYDPGNLYDIGFQLSFAVTWGLILFLPHINRLFARFNFSRPVLYLLLIISSSFIATVIAAPITGFYFGEISSMAVISNLLVVPLVSAAVIGIVILLLVNVIFPALAIIPGTLLDGLLTVTHQSVSWFGQWKHAMVTPPSFSSFFVFIVLGMVTVLMLSISHRFMRKILLAAVVGLAGYVAIYAFLISPKDGPDIEIYNFGSTRTIIINRGPGIVIFQQDRFWSGDMFSTGLLPYLTRRQVAFPRYFVFTEPLHQTEYRLEQAAEQVPHVHFYPTGMSSGLTTGSVWKACEQTLEPATDSGVLECSPSGSLIIRLADCDPIIYSSRLEDLNLLPVNLLQQTSHHIVSIDDTDNLAGLCEFAGHPNMVFLLGQCRDIYMDLPEISCLPKESLIPAGESRTEIYLNCRQPNKY